MEPKLLRVLYYLLSISAFKQGDVIDSGANDGSSSVVLATMFPKHTVWAIEPLKSNVFEIYNKVKAYNVTNVKALRGGLGDVEGFGSYPSDLDMKKGSIRLQIMKSKNVRGNSSYPIFTIDTLFSHKTLSFAHLDVEGSETMVLDGAVVTILRDRPVFTVETHYENMKMEHDMVMKQISRLNYSAYKVNERCGARDCRNFVCVPNEWRIVNMLLKKYM
tara:strand:+ start:274 stop:927 length:654 start_codon:yes stop_codon:yes gene_type:complete